MATLVIGTLILVCAAPFIAFRRELHSRWITRQERKKYRHYVDF